MRKTIFLLLSALLLTSTLTGCCGPYWRGGGYYHGGGGYGYGGGYHYGPSNYYYHR